MPSAPRIALQTAALKIANDYEREARNRLLHMNVALADLEVKGTKRNGMLPSMDDGFEMGGRELRTRNF